MRLNSLVIVPVLFITALLRFTKAWANSGFFCIVNTELGQNPNVSLKKETNSCVSLSSIVDKGVTNGIILLRCLLQVIR